MKRITVLLAVMLMMCIGGSYAYAENIIFSADTASEFSALDKLYELDITEAYDIDKTDRCIKIIPKEEWSGGTRIWGYGDFNGVDFENTKRNIIITMNIMPFVRDASSMDLRICSNKNSKISDNFAKYLSGYEWNEVNVIYDKGLKKAAVAVNGSLKNDWADTSFGSGEYKTIRMYYDCLKENSIYMKNIDIIEADEALEYCGDSSAINLNCENEAGDYEFFDSNEISIGRKAQYLNFTVTENGNSISLPRLDYKNPKREKYIFINKTKANAGCSAEIALERRSYTKNTSKKYNYYTIKKSITLFRGMSTSELVNLKFKGNTVKLLTVDGSGNIKQSENSDLAFGEKTNIIVFVNLQSGTAEIYINGAFQYSVDVPKEYGYPQTVQCQFVSGIGKAYIEDWTVTGTVLPQKNGKEQKSSIYPDDSEVRNYLKDKTAFHQSSGTVCKNGEKGKCDFFLDENNMYVSYASINEAFDMKLAMNGSAASDGSIEITANGIIKNGIQIKRAGHGILKDGKMYIPVQIFAKEILQKYVYSYQTGMIVISDEPSRLNDAGWQYMFLRDDSAITLLNDIDFVNGFLQYDRPDTAILKSGFNQSHPRILCTSGDFEKLKLLKNDGVYKTVYDKMIAYANEIVYNAQVSEYTYDDSIRTLNTANEVKNRFLYLGYAYRMTGEHKYLNRAYAEVEALLEFPDYNPCHIIDTGTYAFAAAIAYDWFYDGYNDEQRENAKRLCLLCLDELSAGYCGRITSTADSMTGGWSAFKETSNFNSIVNGGAMCAAIAAADNCEEELAEIIKNSIRGFEYCLMRFSPKGAWSESLNYWNYSLEFWIYAVSSLNSTFSESFGLETAMGLDNTLNFAKACIGECGVYNFHDSPPSKIKSYDSFMYLAGLTNNDEARNMRIYDLRTSNVKPSIQDALFYEYGDEIKEKEIQCEYIEGAELFSVRKKADGFYFGTHFGTTSGYHQHSDASTFVLDMLGERWAEDLGAEDYNLQNEYGYKDYQLYRKREEGHNVIVVKPAEDFSQKQNEFIPITKYRYDDKCAYAAADMSGIYSGADKMNMGYYIGDDYKSVTMRNEFYANEAEEVYWFMHTKADITIDNNIAYLSKNGKSIKIIFTTNAEGAQIYAMEAKPLSTSPHPKEQNDNAEYKKLAIKLKANAETVLNVKICTADCGDNVSDKKISEWDVNEETERILYEPKKAEDFTGCVRCIPTDNEVGTVMGINNDDNGRYTCYNEFNAGEINERYIRIGLDFIPEGAGARIATAQNKTVAELTDCYRGKKNGIAVIYDRFEKKAKTFVNGIEGEWKDAELSGNNCIRLIADGNGVGDYITVLKYKISACESITEVPEVPLIKTDYKTDQNAIYIPDGASAENIICTNCSMKIYGDETMTFSSNPKMLCDGNIIELKGKNSYAYYRVSSEREQNTDTAEKTLELKNEFSQLTSQGCKMTEITSAYGKSEYDKALELRGHENESAYYIQYCSERINNEKFTVDMLIYPDKNALQYLVATSSNLKLSEYIEPSAFRQGEWNRLTVTHDGDINTVYINNKRYSISTGEVKNNVFRLIAYGSAGENEKLAYIDNFIVYKGCAEPENINIGYINDGIFIYGMGDETAKNINDKITEDSSIYSPSGEKLNAESVYEDCILKVKCDNGLEREYIFKNKYGQFSKPAVSNGTATIYTYVLNPVKVQAFEAAYGNMNELTEIKCVSSVLSGKKIIQVNKENNVFIWEEGTLKSVLTK